MQKKTHFSCPVAQTYLEDFSLIKIFSSQESFGELLSLDSLDGLHSIFNREAGAAHTLSELVRDCSGALE